MSKHLKLTHNGFTVSVSYDAGYNEYQATLRNNIGKVTATYHTDDPRDCIGTAAHMVKVSQDHPAIVEALNKF